MRDNFFRLLIFLVTLFLGTNVVGAQIKKTDGKPHQLDSLFIFTYSPGPRNGLHLAVSENGTDWHEVGTLLTSDYGQWGAEKRMFNPYLYRESEQSWMAVWQVNDYAPCFATAVTGDLINWRPQDYPRMSVKGCLSPIINHNGDSYDVVFKTKNGDFRSTTTRDFRHFSNDQISDNSSYSPQFISVSIDGKIRSGQKWHVSKNFALSITNHLADLKVENQFNTERLAGDNDKFRKQIENYELNKQPLQTLLTIKKDDLKKISDKLIGVFFEDISYAADGGLYAEMVQNRDFEYFKGENHHDKNWGPTFSWKSNDSIVIDTVMPLSKNNIHYAVLNANALTNNGWDGFYIQHFNVYNFSMFTRCLDHNSMEFRVSLIDGSKMIATTTVKVKGKNWNKVLATLTAQDDAQSAVLKIEPLRKGRVAVDMISLFPQSTFKGHSNGLRNDLAQTIADLHPKFMRFPGGCLSHGDGLDNIYNWKESIGPLQNRVPDRNIWNYHQTKGLGFYEFFQFCEDIGCEPLPVLAAGVPCQNSAADSCGFGGQQGGIPMAEMPRYVQDILDLIEWANGDPNTNKWAKMRADAGHPAPFNLHYIGIGNEDLISTVFEERYMMICKAIKDKYPEIKVCGTVGPFHKGSSDYQEGWNFAKNHQDIIDMVDEHYYESTGWFMHNQDYYDNYDRHAPKVYLGEYAASTSKKRSNVETALTEALYLCNVERNADVVSMTSYAPLLAKERHTNWNPDMIYFNNNHISTTPSYETQRLFSKYSGDEYISSKISADTAVAYRLGASVVRDSKSGNIYLKLVNMLPVPVRLNVDLSSLGLLPVSTEGFSGMPDDVRFKIDAEQILMEGSTAMITMKPYSLQIITLK
jgi:alpha-L-arabinofuranosidase